MLYDTALQGTYILLPVFFISSSAPPRLRQHSEKNMPEFVLNFARNLTSGVVGVLRGIITSGMGGNATGTGLPTFSNEIPITSNSAPSTGPSSTAQVANLVGILRMPWRLAAILQDIPHYDGKCPSQHHHCSAN